jgi:hypothetical protein
MESIQSRGRQNPYDDVGISEEYDEHANLGNFSRYNFYGRRRKYKN